jgi:hypothetical protein
MKTAFFWSVDTSASPTPSGGRALPEFESLSLRQVS